MDGEYRHNEGEDFTNRPESRKPAVAVGDADCRGVYREDDPDCARPHAGNPRLREMGFKEEALGHNAIAGGFQGQRQWTDWKPNGDYTGSADEHLVRLERHTRAFVLATENDACNGVATCCSGTCSQVAARCSPMCVHTGAPKRLNV